MGLTREKLEPLFTERGLSFFGVVPLSYPEAFAKFSEWLSQGIPADLAYLTQYREVRENPEKLLPGAKNALIFGLPYYEPENWPLNPQEPPRIAQYARLKDYHKILRKEGEAIAATLGEGKSRVVVDTAPVLERALAQMTQEGFIGKNTCFIHPKRGSFFLLGEILTTLELPFDQKREKMDCGNCTFCQDACPTGALNKDYEIDAKRCLSYWTIEHRGPIPEEFWPHLAKYVFGCDICQLVCPFNDTAEGNERKIERRIYPDLFEVATMDQKKYEEYFGGTPLTRAKRNGLRRNALIAMTVTRHARLAEALNLAEQDTASPIGETIEQITRYLTTAAS